MSYTREQFIAKIAPLAQEDSKISKILPSLTIAQAILESGNGNSGLTIRANNLFGIKGSYKGQSILMPTIEYYGGVKQQVNAAFRKYPSWLESIQDHSSLFNRLDRYKNIRGCKDYKIACVNVQKDGYATDPQYAKLLIKLIETYNLTQYDKVIEEDTELIKAVSKIIHDGININFNCWKRVDLIKLNNVPSLLNKLGGLEQLIYKGIITEKERWLTGQYKANDVRSLLIKYSKTLP